MNQDKIKEILDSLNTLNEYLLSLRDDILLNIDPSDNESVQQGAQFIQEFNDNFDQFNQSARKLEKQIQKYFAVNPEAEKLEHETVENNSQSSRLIEELNNYKFHTLDDNFTYKRPYAFVLNNSAYKGFKTWKSLYLQVLTELKIRDSELFLNLLTEKQFISKRGNPWFAKNSNELRSAEELTSDFFVEVNLSANIIRNNLKDILNYFAIDYQDLKIYFREDIEA